MIQIYALTPRGALLKKDIRIANDIRYWVSIIRFFNIVKQSEAWLNVLRLCL